MKGARAMPTVNIKMPAELKEQLTEKAQRNFRSLSSEIVKRLHDSLGKEASRDAHSAA